MGTRAAEVEDCLGCLYLEVDWLVRTLCEVSTWDASLNAQALVQERLNRTRGYHCTYDDEACRQAQATQAVRRGWPGGRLAGSVWTVRALP